MPKKKSEDITWIDLPLSKSTNKAILLKAKSRSPKMTKRRYLQYLIHKDLRED